MALGHGDLKMKFKSKANPLQENQTNLYEEEGMNQLGSHDECFFVASKKSLSFGVSFLIGCPSEKRIYPSFSASLAIKHAQYTFFAFISHLKSLQ